MDSKVNVLNRGYVILHDVLGSDLTVANAARVSFDKKSDKMSPRDENLIRFLAEEGHTSPFRHATLQFEFYAPLMVARQHWKYVVGSNHEMDAWNESSRRYVTEEPTFYIPNENEWRSAPDNKKQGSGVVIGTEIGCWFTDELIDYIQKGEDLYANAMEKGICAEQARLFLPAYGMYVRYYWTTSLQAVCHFLNQRLAHDAQKEITDYAKAVHELTQRHFPLSVKHLVK